MVLVAGLELAISALRMQCITRFATPAKTNEQCLSLDFLNLSTEIDMVDCHGLEPRIS